MTSSEVTGSESPEPEVMNRNGNEREIISHAFLSPGFYRVFTSETHRGLLRNFWEFPFHFAQGNIDQWKSWKSTNEMPQSPFQLANHGSPYRSNESVRTIYFWLFVEALSFVQSNSNVNLCFFQFENRHFLSPFHSDRTCLSCGIENIYPNKGKYLNPTRIF